MHGDQPLLTVDLIDNHHHMQRPPPIYVEHHFFELFITNRLLLNNLGRAVVWPDDTRQIGTRSIVSSRASEE